ncbi:MAG: DUF4340 domain-containing protein [Proteobacteria bacterium]|nr:DUF4340 domain-containing protein [Pseudomonadota bacterium]
MKRWIPLLGGVLVLQLALAAVLTRHGDRLAPQRSDAKLVAADLKDIDRLTIAGPVAPDAAASAPTPLVIVKKDGRWQMPGYFDAPADAVKVQAMVDRLGRLQRGLPIATTAGALDRFEVSDRHYERRIVAAAGEKTLATVYIGASAGPRKSDARTDADAAVYAVELSSYELPVGGQEWLDAGLLARDAKTIAAIDVAMPGRPDIALARAAAAGASSPSGAVEWQAQNLPAGAKLDAKRAAALADALADVKVDAVLGRTAVADWQQDQPELTLTTKDAAGKSTTWVLSKRKSGDSHVLKASDRPWFVELQPYHAQPLLDAAAPEKLVAGLPAAAAASAPADPG